ncbi:MAG: histidine kinase [Allomuricauda sp.]|nr:MAG: histidine kinase [Allomuricauda sp.]
MNLSDKKRNRIFWILQLGGWGFLNMFSIVFLRKFGPEFVIFSVFTGTFIGILSTTLLRYYLKRNISLDDFRAKEFLKIGGAILVAAIIYGGLSFVLGLAYGKMGMDLSEGQKEMLKAFDNPLILVFNSIFMMSAWVICYLVIKLLLRANKNRLERLELNTNLKQAQLNTLKGQINPHFMFNSLNNIRGLMLEDVEKSREMLTKLSEMLRYSLTKNNVNAIAVEEELEMVDNYIALSKIQFEDRLVFTKNIGPEVLQTQIPPMIIQLLVENAAKHGIANLKQGGTICLNIHKNQKNLDIKVKNTGQLKIDKDSTQLGIKNIKQRLKLLYGDTSSFSLTEVNNEVVATIKIPLS